MLDLGTLQAHIKLDGADKFQNDLETSGNKANSIGSKIKGGLVKVGHALKTAFIAAGAALTTAFIAVGKGAIEAYKDTEQLRGGVEKLYGDTASQTVIDNANKAFETIGMSANDYMENVTSFSASLISSLGGDTQKAAEVADMALTDMADNASIFGTDMQSIQNAYQGFAKQNYTMLDNLKLGYGGTKTEMERLLHDAQELSGVEYNIDNLNDVYQAIHVIQEEQGIAGNAAKENAKTIEGSINSTKAAYANFLSGLADSNADIGQLTDNLINSALNVVNNITPVIEQIISSIGTALPKVLSSLIDLLPGILETLTSLVIQVAQALPGLIVSLAQALVDALPGVISAIVEVLPQLIENLVNAIVDLIPILVEGFVELLLGFVEAIDKALPAIIAAIPKLIQAICDALPVLIPAIARAGIELFKALVQNLPAIIDAIIQCVPIIIQALIDTFGAMWDLMIETWGDLFGMIGQACQPAIDALNDFFSWLEDGWNAALEAVASVIEGFASAAAALWDSIVNAVSSFVDSVISFFQNLFSSAQSIFNSLVDAVSGLVSSVIGFFNNLLSGIEGIFSNITSAIQSGIDWITGIPGMITNAVGDLGNLLYNAGQDVIQGFLNGLQAVWDNVTGWISNAMDGLPGPVKEALGIGSPSKVFAELGRWTMEGFSEGLEKQENGILKQVKDISSNLTNAFNPSLSANLAVAGGGTVKGNNVNATQTMGNNYSVYINGTRINDDASIEGKFKELLYEMARKGMM